MISRRVLLTTAAAAIVAGMTGLFTQAAATGAFRQMDTGDRTDGKRSEKRADEQAALERPRDANHLREVLKAAEEIRVYRGPDVPELTAKPIVVLSERSYRKFFRLMKSPERFNSKGGGLRLVYMDRLVIRSKGKVFLVGYSRLGGVISPGGGGPNQYAIAQVEARTWLDNKLAVNRNLALRR